MSEKWEPWQLWWIDESSWKSWMLVAYRYIHQCINKLSLRSIREQMEMAHYASIGSNEQRRNLPETKEELVNQMMRNATDSICQFLASHHHRSTTSINQRVPFLKSESELQFEKDCDLGEFESYKSTFASYEDNNNDSESKWRNHVSSMKFASSLIQTSKNDHQKEIEESNLDNSQMLFFLAFASLVSIDELFSFTTSYRSSSSINVEMDELFYKLATRVHQHLRKTISQELYKSVLQDSLNRYPVPQTMIQKHFIDLYIIKTLINSLVVFDYYNQQ